MNKKRKQPVVCSILNAVRRTAVRNAGKASMMGVFEASVPQVLQRKGGDPAGK